MVLLTLPSALPSILSHKTIERYIHEGKIKVSPEFEKKDIRPTGIRIHLGRHILVPEPNQLIEINVPQDLKYKEVDLTKEEFILEPNQFILGATCESIQTPRNILAILDGRSTIARLGITTHITASILDGTFSQPHVVVLEIKNVGNFRIKLKFKDPIAMMIFSELTEPVSATMKTLYDGQVKVTPPNLNLLTEQVQ